MYNLKLSEEHEMLEMKIKTYEVKIEQINNDIRNQEEIKLGNVNEVYESVIDLLLFESEEDKFELGGILEESDRIIEEHKKDNIDLWQKSRK